MNFWDTITAQLDAIATGPADTFDKVRDALNDLHGSTDPYLPPAKGPNAAFFAGSGGDATLNEALSRAGWRLSWAEANYYWEATHSTTGEVLTYIEGDVIRGAHK